MNESEKRIIPQRRDMDLIGNVFKDHWGKIIVTVFALGGVWATLQAQLSNHSADIRAIKEEVKPQHDFIIAQGEINQNLAKGISDLKQDMQVNKMEILREIRRR